jgi:hypothetical protein
MSVSLWPRTTHVNTKVVVPEFALQKPVQGRTEQPISREVLPDPTHRAYALSMNGNQR